MNLQSEVVLIFVYSSCFACLSVMIGVPHESAIGAWTWNVSCSFAWESQSGKKSHGTNWNKHETYGKCTSLVQLYDTAKDASLPSSRADSARACNKVVPTDPPAFQCRRNSGLTTSAPRGKSWGQRWRKNRGNSRWSDRQIESDTAKLRFESKW